MTNATTARLRLGSLQVSLVEVHVLDVAHDEERADWWPTLEGSVLVIDLAHRDTLCEFFTDIANANDEGGDREYREAATTIARRIRRA